MTAREVGAAAAASLEPELAAAAAAAGLAAVAQVAQAGGGIAISGLPADFARFNATYLRRMGQLVEGFPSYTAGPTRHLFRHPGIDAWHLDNRPFDPTENGCLAWFAAAGGPVPTGARAWAVALRGKWARAEVTACEVA